MKYKKIFLCICFLLTGCRNEKISSLVSSSSIVHTENSFSSSVSLSSSIESLSPSSFSSIFSEERPSGYNPDGGGLRMPIPENKESKIVLGKDNASLSHFSLMEQDASPFFRPIYGNNFVKGDRYSDGSLKISSVTDAKQGFQTAMFIADRKLEIRLNIGQMHGSQGGNHIDKNLPVLSIYGFDENGNYLRANYIDNISESQENSSIRCYMDGTDLSYLEVRAMQLPYSGSKAYNFSFTGIDLIAWPYSL